MPKDREPDFFGTAGGELKLPPVRPLGRVKQRLIRSAVEIEADDPESLLFQHTVFCQTGLPYHDPGAAVREWERAQGSVALKVQAGEAHNPETGAWVKRGLPWGVPSGEWLEFEGGVISGLFKQLGPVIAAPAEITP